MRSLTESFRECRVDKQTDDSSGHGSAVPNRERWTHSESMCVCVLGRGGSDWHIGMLSRRCV